MPPPSEVVLNEGRLYHLGIAPGEVAKRVFLVGDPARALRVAARFDAVAHEVRHREYVTLTGRHRGLEMSVIGTGIGTDNVEIALVELHAAHLLAAGGDGPSTSPPELDIIRVGTSGGVQPDVAAGTLCIAEYALGLDSTGLFFDLAVADPVVAEMERQADRLLAAAVAPGSRFHGRLPTYGSKADRQVHQALMRCAETAAVPHASGITVATPGFFGASSRYVEGLVNTVPDIKGLLAGLSVEGRRVLNMEMESSLLFHLAAALGHRAGTVCPAISQPGSHAAVVDYEAAIEAAIDVALGAMVTLSEP